MEEFNAAAICRRIAAWTIASTLIGPAAPAFERATSLNIKAESSAKIHLNIQADDAQSMIGEFIRQSGMEVLYLSDDVKDQVLTPLAGEYEPAEGLSVLLSGSDLRASLVVRTDRIEANLHRVIRRPPSAGPRLADSTQMLVTGSHLRNVLDVAAPLKVIDRDEMIREGSASVEAAVQQLPTNMGSAFSEDFGGVGNFGRGTALNLRGLGAGATLVLVNGRRQPQAGLFADFVDVSNIPWSIVERIEVLPDGSSAIYGSDAIAGVVNIILRDELDGAESQLRIGAASDGASEVLAAQLFGNRWNSGHWLAAYQYSHRTALAAADRAYAANADKRAFGGRDYRAMSANPGNILDPVTFEPRFAIPAGQDGTLLDASELVAGSVNLQNQYIDYQLLPNKESHGVFLSAAQALTERIKLFGEGRSNRREISWVGWPEMRILIVPRTNAFFVDPFGGGSAFLPVAYNFSEDLGPIRGTGITRSRLGTLGAEARLQNGWLATLSGTWGQESLLWRSRGQADITGQALAPALADSNPSTAFNPFGDGSHTNHATLDAIHQLRRSEAISTISAASIHADGSVFDLLGGQLKAAIGVEARIESLDRVLIGRDFQYRPQHYRRSISAAFTELAIPLIGNPSDANTAPRLQTSLAARYEDYSDFGNTFNPKITVQWAPHESIKLRGSWGASFKAPKLVDLYDTSQNLIGPTLLPDPRSPTGESLVLFREGNNLDLREETARTWSIGFDIAPHIKSKLAVTVTAYAVEYRDRVFQPYTVTQGRFLLDETRWQDIITRSPSVDHLQTLCAHPDLMIETSECLALSPAVYIDGRLRNMAITRASGLDLDVSHSHRSFAGMFAFNWSGHYVTSYEQAPTSSSPASNLLDTVGNPLRLKLQGTVSWSHRPDGKGIGAMVSARHLGSYNNVESPLRPDVSSMTTLDLTIRYRTGSERGWWRDGDFVLSALNILNHAPSFVDSELGYDAVNMEPLGRNLGLHFQKSWGSN